MPELSFVAALIGGMLSILSPCSALLLPAFFAVSFTSRTRLVTQAVAFYAGLVTLFVPLGPGVSLAASLFVEQRDLVIALAGAALVGFGLYTLSGGGLELAPAVAHRLFRVRGHSMAYVTGLAYGVGGFCTGPILGSVLAIAAASGEVVTGAALLATYALGMTLPVFVLALGWDRWRIGERRWMHGAEVSAFGFAMPASRLVAGLMFVLMGIVFVLFRGSSALGRLYEDLGLTDAAQRIQIAVQGIDIDQWVALAGAALVVGSVTWRAVRAFGVGGGRARSTPAAEPSTRDADLADRRSSSDPGRTGDRNSQEGTTVAGRT